MDQHPADERPVEEALRGILGPMDRHLDGVYHAFAVVLIAVFPVVFLGLWLSSYQSGRRSIGWGCGAFGVVLLLRLGWDAFAARLARGRFDRRFPLGSPERATALRVLDEMETPSKAEEKLRDALASQSSDRVVRRRATGEAWPAENKATEEGPKSGGYFDYIPLEPRNDEVTERKA